jgi:hypothetical protein
MESKGLMTGGPSLLLMAGTPRGVCGSQIFRCSRPSVHDSGPVNSVQLNPLTVRSEPTNSFLAKCMEI